MTDYAHEPTTRRKKRGPVRKFFVFIAWLLAIAALIGGALYVAVTMWLGDVDRVSTTQPAELVRPAAGEGVNILLLGSDARDTSGGAPTENDLAGSRTDSIMVAQVSPTGEVTVMSIMRDNWVDIQGYGEAKINAAMAFGGLPLTVNTVENFIGARIDHVAIVDFASFVGLTDAVGGVTVNNPQAFTTADGGHSFEAGEITLTGDEALGFVRERYAFTDGDYQRARNQQLFMRGLAQQLLTPSTVTNPKKLLDTATALQPYLTLDEGFDAATVRKLAWAARGASGDKLTFFTSPTLGTGTSADGQSIVIPDEAELQLVRKAFAAGTVHEYAKNAE